MPSQPFGRHTNPLAAAPDYGLAPIVGVGEHRALEALLNRLGALVGPCYRPLRVQPMIGDQRRAHDRERVVGAVFNGDERHRLAELLLPEAAAEAVACARD